jgi:DNA primase
LSSGSSDAQAVKARLNIADVVRRYVELRRAGPRWMAPCPFHNETKPSFSVNEEEGFFFCFGCQAAGDVIDFYCRINGLEFREGLEELAKEAGVDLQRSAPESPRAKEEKSFKKLCLEMYALAANRFMDNLKGPNSGVCRDYLRGRGISQETAERFKLGWSSPGWHDMEHFLLSKGFDNESAVRSGLIIKNERGKIYDRFRGRVIFPIESVASKVVAFGGRILGSEDEAKYINSSDSPIYKKGDHLYGLPQARHALSRSRRMLLTEGYMDVLTLHQFGFDNACGVLGTALTSTQAQRIAGFCSGVTLLFDGDGAGRKAALRAAEMFLTRGLDCKVALMPDGEDVDSVLQASGKEALDALLNNAPEGLEYCLRMVSSEFSPKEVLDWVKSFMGHLAQPGLGAHYIPRLAHGLKMSETELRRVISGEAVHAVGNREEAGSGSMTMSARERGLLYFVIHYPGHFSLLEEKGAQKMLVAHCARALWEKAYRADKEDVWPLLTAEEKRFWVECLDQKPRHDKPEQEELADILQLLDNTTVEGEAARITDSIRERKSAGDHDGDLDLLRQLQEKQQQMGKLQ